MAVLNTKAKLTITNQEYTNKKNIASNLTKINTNIDNISTNTTAIANLQSNSGRTVVTVGGTGRDWYRIYSDGWVEQGGVTPTGSDTTVVATFHIEFKDTNYTILTTPDNPVGSSTGKTHAIPTTRTTKTCDILVYTQENHSTFGAMWVACGYKK